VRNVGFLLLARAGTHLVLRVLRRRRLLTVLRVRVPRLMAMRSLS